MKEDKSRDIITLSGRDHVLQKSGMYIGNIQPTEHEDWVIDEDNLVKKKITYTDGLLKIINEAIDNSIDEGIKTDWKYSNKISVKIDGDKVIIEDNGRGLKIAKNSDGEWMPVAAFTKIMTGSNFGEGESKSIGTFGVGVSATNIFSKKFEVVTCDGKAKMKIVCKNNMAETSHTLFDIKDSDTTGTKVSFIPDYDRFGVKGITNEIELLVRTRLAILSWFYPKCDLKYNGKKVNLKASEFADMLPKPVIVRSTPKAYIAVYPSHEDGFEYLTYVNGLYLRRGGTHTDYISNVIISDIREKLSRTYKNIKPSDIKNRLGLVVLFKDFPHCQFDSQSKELLTNTEKDIKSYLEDIDLTARISNKILKDKEFLDNITEMYKLKEELKEKKDLEKLSKKVKTVDSDKYFPPIAHSGKEYLMITEGYSAFAGISKCLGRKSMGYYTIRGKLLNCQDLSPSKFMQNQEINELVNILGIDLTNKNTDMTYKYVVILTDADPDGLAISGLILTLFSKIAPRMLKEGRICRLNTPLLIGKDSSGKIREYYYNFPDQTKLNKRLKYKYLKGLGSWNKDELNQIITTEGGMNNMLLKYITDDDSNKTIDNWFGAATDERKLSLKGREFHIDNM